MTANTQGQAANLHGEQNLRAVGGILCAHGFVAVTLDGVNPDRPDPVRRLGRAIREGGLLLTRPYRVFSPNVVVCRGIHGAPFVAHYLLWSEGWPEPLALMCRSQHSSGSALEKLEHLYATVYEKFPCRAVVVLAGSAFTGPVLGRARSWVVRSKGRLARVFEGLSDMRCWLTDGALYPPPPEPVLPGIDGEGVGGKPECRP